MNDKWDEGVVTISMTQLSNAADWHANMALKAYRKRLYGDYRRHIRIADQLRACLL